MSLDIELTIPDNEQLSEEILSPCFYSISPVDFVPPIKSCITIVPWTNLQDPWEGIETDDYLPSDDDEVEVLQDCGNRQASSLSSVEPPLKRSKRCISKTHDLTDACLTLETFQDFLINNQSASQEQVCALLLKSVTLVMEQIDKFMLLSK